MRFNSGFKGLRHRHFLVAVRVADFHEADLTVAVRMPWKNVAMVLMQNK